MKKFITLFAMLFAFAAGAQLRELGVEIIGNNECRFPYNDNEPITLRISGLAEGQWYEIAFPTNYLESHPKPEVAREVALFFRLNNGMVEMNTQASTSMVSVPVLISAAGVMDYTFNGPGSVYSNFRTLTQWYQGHLGWYLPPNTSPKQYYLSVRPFNSDKSAKAYFWIIP